ncbi:hypothetical protein T459_27609 [Capsicum annuum]|uniref:Uncharacterized protein n=1 Tax=Capsicum annuum TaxID=4072 RepID=A0A2G2YEE2_CAPAN|nr:hypothetical protein T459_27609 [Capsicum annuum]
MAYDATFLPVSEIQWLGVFVQDSDKYSIPQKCLLPLIVEVRSRTSQDGSQEPPSAPESVARDRIREQTRNDRDKGRGRDKTQEAAQISDRVGSLEVEFEADRRWPGGLLHGPSLGPLEVQVLFEPDGQVGGLSGIRRFVT